VEQKTQIATAPALEKNQPAMAAPATSVFRSCDFAGCPVGRAFCLVAPCFQVEYRQRDLDQPTRPGTPSRGGPARTGQP
jgi:hypothetical protein